MIALFDRFKIVAIKKQDAYGVHRLMCSDGARFRRYFPKTLEENNTLIKATSFAAKKEREFKNKEEFLFVIKNTDEVVGLAYIKELNWKKKQGEFAYCIHGDYEGKGIMTKTVERLSLYAFAELGLEVLRIIVHKNNMASVNVAERCNFSWKKTLLNEYTPPNETPLDMELYELYK